MIKRTSRAIFVIAFTIGLFGCGQKGPLYLPEPAPTNAPAEPAETRYKTD